MTLPLEEVRIEDTSLSRGKDALGAPGTRMLELAPLHRIRPACQPSRTGLAVNESAVSLQCRSCESNLLVKVKTSILGLLRTTTFQVEGRARKTTKLALDIPDSFELGYNCIIRQLEQWKQVSRGCEPWLRTVVVKGILACSLRFLHRSSRVRRDSR